VVVHGLSDKRIKPSHGLAIYENLSSEHKLFIPLDTATHSNLWQVGGEDYFEDVFDFLEWVE
jgi:esterase/lipase